MGGGIAFLIGVISMVFLFWFFDSYPDPKYYETFLAKWFPSFKKQKAPSPRINRYR